MQIQNVVKAKQGKRNLNNKIEEWKHGMSKEHSKKVHCSNTKTRNKKTRIQSGRDARNETIG